MEDWHLNFVEDNVLYSAQLFLHGEDNWNDDDKVNKVCAAYDIDEDFVWLACRVLFGPAVVFQKTGHSV